MQTIKGQVADVRLPRHAGGWGVVTLLCGSANERASVVGYPLGVEVGDTIECAGEWTSHPKYGRQFSAREIRTLVPTDASGVIAWLLSRMPNVGRRIATAMVEAFGVPGVWHVLEHEPERLAELRGITPKRAAAIHTRYMELLPERDRAVTLKSFGLTDRQVARVVEVFGSDAVDEIRRDPYQLIERVPGFGWVRADELARRLGLPANHPARIRAGITHLLEEARARGHCYVPAGRLIAMAARDLSRGTGARVTEAEVVREGRELIASGRAVQREGRGRKGPVARVYLAAVDEAEGAVAAAVRRLMGASAFAQEEGEAK